MWQVPRYHNIFKSCGKFAKNPHKPFRFQENFVKYTSKRGSTWRRWSQQLLRDMRMVGGDVCTWKWPRQSPWQPNRLELRSDFWKQQDGDRHVQPAEKDRGGTNTDIRDEGTERSWWPRHWLRQRNADRMSAGTEEMWERWEDSGKTESTASLRWPQTQQAKRCDGWTERAAAPRTKQTPTADGSWTLKGQTQHFHTSNAP